MRNTWFAALKVLHRSWRVLFGYLFPAGRPDFLLLIIGIEVTMILVRTVQAVAG